MFIHYRSRGFVLKKEDQGEADQLFTVYTKDFGKLDILGKAIRKITSKLRGSIDVFSLCEIEFIQGKAYKTLTDVILIDRFRHLSLDFKKLKVAYRIAEVLDDLVRGQDSDNAIWQLLSGTFKKLEDGSLKIGNPIIYYYFLWNFLSVMGFRPELHNCSICQKKLKPEDIYFNIKEGGLVCPACQGEEKTGELVNADTIKILRIILAEDWPTLEKIKIEAKNLKSLKKISDYYLSEVSKNLLE